MIYTEHFTFNSFYTRCIAVWDKDGFCAIVDPGFCSISEKESLTSFLDSKRLKPVCILLTHGHFDHIYGVSELMEEYDIPVYMHRNELSTIRKVNPILCRTFGLPLPDVGKIEDGCTQETSGHSNVRFVREGDLVQAGSLNFETVETPGHTAGGVCFLERNEKTLFSGDTLFAGAIGRTDHPEGDYDMLMKSIFDKLMILDGDINVFPGHGRSTSIAEERTTNPFLLPFNEHYED